MGIVKGIEEFLEWVSRNSVVFGCEIGNFLGGRLSGGPLSVLLPLPPSVVYLLNISFLHSVDVSVEDFALF